MLSSSPPHTPLFADASSCLCKSIRIESGTKQPYEGIQSRQNGTGKPGKPYKKFKFTVQEVSGISPTSGSHLLAEWGWTGSIPSNDRITRS